MGKRILVIDDEEQMRSLVSAMLEDEGFEISVASDGNVALRLHKKKPADLIITDLIMPEKEGVETILEFKTDFPEVRIIAMSGGGRIEAEEYLDLAGTLGADWMLAKPFSKGELMRAVKELLP